MPQLHRAWGQFLGHLPWDLFVTLTFDPKRVFPVGRDRARREALDWCNTVAASLRRPVGWLIALERGSSGQWHAHGLLIGVSSDINAAAAMWRARNGRIDIQQVTASSGALLYSSKEGYRTGEIFLSDTIDRYLNTRTSARRVELYPGADPSVPAGSQVGQRGTAGGAL